MRRAIAVAVVTGLAGGVAGTGLAWAQRAGAARTAPAAATKTVTYAGYELSVPASWPVYRLDGSPSTCVRYDVHAVYLGTPGADERCPAGLLGRTETVSIIPSAMVAAGAGQQVTEQRAQPFQAGAARVAALPAVGSAVMRNAEQRELRVTLSAAGRPATVIATYNTSPAIVSQVLSTLRTAPRAVAQVAPVSAPTGPPGPPGQAPPTTKAWHGVPSGWPIQGTVQPPPDPPSPSPSPAPPSPAPPSPSPSPPPTPGPFHPVAGFDTCTAPSLATMTVWRRAYAAVGVYVGGVDAACAFGNLSASWVSSAKRMGWGLLPIYVGPQAPCYGAGVTINPQNAAAEGMAAGSDAVTDERLFGLPAGSPVYYDMEAYDNQLSSCTAAVLTFLGAWDRAVTARGYLPGVYSSQDSGIADMQAAAVAKRPGFTVPTAIWIAHWDNVATLADGTLVWPLRDRNKQYQGPHNQTVGGITLNIDSDLAGAILAG